MHLSSGPRELRGMCVPHTHIILTEMLSQKLSRITLKMSDLEEYDQVKKKERGSKTGSKMEVSQGIAPKPLRMLEDLPRIVPGSVRASTPEN